jgi:serine/threonine-protein kinase
MAQSFHDLEQAALAFDAEVLPPSAEIPGHPSSYRPPTGLGDLPSGHQSGLVRAWRGLRPGDLVAGKYRVERLLQHTGFLWAVQVRHLVLDAQATLKYLAPEARAFPEIISNFLRGARLLSQLRSEPIASVLDVGMLEIGTPYLVLDQPDGPDFAQVIRVRGALPVEEARMYVKQICEGMAQAHELGIIHGSLRPSNIVLSKRRDGSPIACITDFGNTEAFDFSELTRPDSGFGTPREVLDAVRYLSPDHARHPDALDARCDVWAIGLLLYELLAGEPAYSGRTAAGLLAAIAADAPPALAGLRSEVPEALEAIVTRCLQKNRENRFSNASQLLRALEAADDLIELGRPTRSEVASTADSRPTQPPPTQRGPSVAPVVQPPATASTFVGGVPQSDVASVSAPLPAGSAMAPTAAAVHPEVAARPARETGPRHGLVAILIGLVVGSVAFFVLEILGNTGVRHAAPAAQVTAHEPIVEATSNPPQPAEATAATPPLESEVATVQPEVEARAVAATAAATPVVATPKTGVTTTRSPVTRKPSTKMLESKPVQDEATTKPTVASSEVASKASKPKAQVTGNSAANSGDPFADF